MPSGFSEQGAPGYIDEAKAGQLSLTLFHEGEVQVKQLKAGKLVRVAPAGRDREPTAEPIEGKVSSVKMAGRQCLLTLDVTASTEKFHATGLARVWVVRD